MNNQNKNDAWGNLGLFLLLLPGIIVGYLVYGALKSEPVIGIILGICVGLLVSALLAKLLLEWSKEAEKKEKQKERKAIADGKWDFPIEEFCRECKKAKIKDAKDLFSEKKARAIADQILRNHHIPEEFYGVYDNKEKLESYLKRGAEIDEERHRKEREEEEKRRSEPQKANMTSAESGIVLHHKKLSEKYGVEKRCAYIEEEISKRRTRIWEIERAQDAALKMAAMVSSSAAQEKTHDWATAGGIASGIAGPVAGAMVASDLVRKNAEIEARNRQNQANVDKMADRYVSLSLKGNDEKYNLEEEIEPLQKKLDATRIKVVFENIPKDELFRSLTIGKSSIVPMASQALKIKTTISSNYVPKGVPAGVKMVVDGTLSGKIYAGGMLVGEIVLPLPEYGVPCDGSSVTVETFCDHYSVNGQPYRVEFTPNKLWVMEK